MPVPFFVEIYMHPVASDELLLQVDFELRFLDNET